MNCSNIYKLQMAINKKYNFNILYSTRQFYSLEQKRPITIHIISKAVPSGKMNTKNIELYRTSSVIKATFFLKGLWEKLQSGEEVRLETLNADSLLNDNR